MRKHYVVVERALTALGLTVLYTVCSGVVVSRDRPDVGLILKKAVDLVKNSFSLSRLREHPIIKAYKDFMWRLGTDPARFRLVSESLIRRILRRGTLTRVNDITDLVNAVILETLIPLSLIDLDKVKLPLLLRYSREGELFRESSSRFRELSGREVVLVDASGKIVYLYPHKESIDAVVDEDSEDIIILAYGAPGIPSSVIRKALRLVSAHICGLYHRTSCSDVRVATSVTEV